MGHPPDLVRKAYADLVSAVFLNIRNAQYSDASQLRDLGDALHNISGVLGDYGAWIEDGEYRRLYVRPYDEKWKSSGFRMERGLEKFLDERLLFYKEGNTGG